MLISIHIYVLHGGFTFVDAHKYIHTRMGRWIRWPNARTDNMYTGIGDIVTSVVASYIRTRKLPSILTRLSNPKIKYLYLVLLIMNAFWIQKDTLSLQAFSIRLGHGKFVQIFLLIPSNVVPKNILKFASIESHVLWLNDGADVVVVVTLDKPHL